MRTKTFITPLSSSNNFGKTSDNDFIALILKIINKREGSEMGRAKQNPKNKGLTKEPHFKNISEERFRKIFPK